MVLFCSAANEFGCPVLDSLQPLNVRCITTQKEPTSIVNARQYQTSNNKVACVNGIYCETGNLNLNNVS